MRSLLPPLLAVLVGCPPGGPAQDTDRPMDWDVDGWFGREDCDDQDPATYPGAEELCDGKDNDCDGEYDEGWEESRPWYRDRDRDGYGAPMDRTRGCEQPDGYVDDHSDCDDGDASIHPGAEDDWYDGVDSDCDGRDDHDADEDGYTWEGSGGDDCDDDNDAVHPGILDWTDELDGDCDGVVDATDMAELPGVLGNSSTSELAAAVTTVPDQDGDGYDDLLLGSPGMGAAWLIAGPITSVVELPDDVIARIDGEGGDDRAGAALCVAGDTDGDGEPELLVGAWLAGSGQGAVYLLATPVRGDTNMAEAAWTARGADAGDYLGYAVAGAGDPDGDGYDDLLIGARGWSDTAADAGAAVLIPGGPGGPGALDTGTWIFGTQERDFAGCAVAGPGDVDGDGLDDVLVGARGEDSGGMAILMLGPISGDQPLVAGQAVMRGEAPYDYAGWSLAGIGDQDGDGYRDVLVGAYGYDTFSSTAGAAYLVLGRGPALWTSMTDLGLADTTLVGESRQDHAGWAVAGPGDVDGDGRADLLVAAPGADLGEDDSGTVYLLMDPERGTMNLREAELRLRGQGGDAAGSSLAPTGDHDGDGLPDLLTGLPGHGNGDGAVRVVGLAEAF